MDPVPLEPLPEPLPAPVQDSICFIVYLDSAAFPVKSLDVLIYDEYGTRPLQAHRRLEREDLLVAQLDKTQQHNAAIEFPLPEGEKRVVAVANSPKPLSMASLSRYDGAKDLTFAFEDETKDYPLMSAVAECVDSCAKLSLEALRGYVMLSTIRNGLDDYELLEEPRVRLRNLNNSVKILQESGFYPTELLDYGAWTALPYDVGIYPQEPGIVLYCFPNSTESSYSTSSTQLELECIVLGEVCSYKINLPAIERSDTVRVELSVAGRYDYSSRIWSSTSQTQLSEDLALKLQELR